MSALAATRFASSGRSMMRGTTIAARIPRIATTTSTSISVNPEKMGSDPTFRPKKRGVDLQGEFRLGFIFHEWGLTPFISR
jgi:hypothetical protein